MATMVGIVKQMLARPIQVADMVIKAADEAQSFKQDCQEIKTKTEKLAGLLRQVARASNDIYERPTRRIVDDTEQVLDKALTLVFKCGATGLLGRLFTIIPAAAFRKLSMQLENSIGDVSWLLAVSGDKDDEYLGLPPIAANEPILCLIWEQIANLYRGTPEERSDASASLVSLARDNERYGKLIIEEGGVPPLLKLAKEGNPEGQENAARAIGLLGRDPESVEQIVNAGVCEVFAKILKEGRMKVQAVVAWAVSELAYHHPKCQDHFSQNNIIRFLVSHLAFETVEEHSKYTVASKQQGGMSIHSVLMASKNPSVKKDESENHMAHPMGNAAAPSQMQNVVTNTMAVKGKNVAGSTLPPQPNNQGNHPRGIASKSNHHPRHISISGTSIKGREFEDPDTKALMKEMAARALGQFCKGNLGICRAITESRALLCFAILLEKSRGNDIRYYSSLALMEITAVAEQNSDLRRSAFKPTSPAAKAVLDQLLKIIIEQPDSELVVPCIKTIGNLARTFRATETRIIPLLVKLLDETEAEISMEAVIALNKFATPKNFLHVIHSKAIIEAGGAKHLIQLVYFGEQMVQFPSLTLLCYIAFNIPDCEILAQEEVLIVLEWAMKQAHLAEDPEIDRLLPEAKSRLELYQSRGSRNY